MNACAKHTFNSLQHVRDMLSVLWMHCRGSVFCCPACSSEFVPLPPEETEGIFSACALPAYIRPGHGFNDCNMV